MTAMDHANPLRDVDPTQVYLYFVWSVTPKFVSVVLLLQEV